MIDAQLVQIAELFPRMCICGSQTGPLVDTHMEIYDRRIYVCKSCGRQLARVFGFAKGAELDRLVGAREELDRMVKAMDERQARVLRLETELAEAERERARALEERDIAVGEADHLKHIARAIEAQTHDLVGDNAA